MKVVQHGSDRVGFSCAAMLLAIALANPWATRSTSAADAPRIFRESAAEGGELRYVQGIPVLLLEGEPERMGAQQGALVLDVARRHAGVAKTMLGDYGGGLLWPMMVTLGRSLLKEAPERYRRELDAAFAKAKYNQDEIDAIVVANSLVELRCFGFCSAFLVEPERSAGGEMLFGRNFDVPSYGALDRLVLVAVCRPAKKHAFASVTWPGFVGVLSGMNEKGVAIACLDSGAARDNSPFFSLGSPLSLTFRQILEEASTLEEAEKLLAAAKRTTWMNLAACDRKRAAVFEITPKSVVVRRAEEHLLACTNHFRSPELSLTRQCGRYRILQSLWRMQQPFSWQAVAVAMHWVNLGQDTTQTMIFEPKSLRLRLSLGMPPASSGPYVPLELGPLFHRKVATEVK